MKLKGASRKVRDPGNEVVLDLDCSQHIYYWIPIKQLTFTVKLSGDVFSLELLRFTTYFAFFLTKTFKKRLFNVCFYFNSSFLRASELIPHSLPHYVD